MSKAEVAVSTSNKTEINEILGIVGSAPDSEATKKALFPGVYHLNHSYPLIDDSRLTSVFKKVMRSLLKDRILTRKFIDHSDLKIAVPVKNGVQLIPKKEILYLEASGNYTKVYRKDEKTLLVSKTMKLFEPAMQEAYFVRIHRKYLVNIYEIDAFLKSNGGELLMSNGACLSVSKKQQDQIRVMLEQISSFV